MTRKRFIFLCVAVLFDKFKVYGHPFVSIEFDKVNQKSNLIKFTSKSKILSTIGISKLENFFDA